MPATVSTTGGGIVVSEINSRVEEFPTITLLEKAPLTLVTSYGEFLMKFDSTELLAGFNLKFSEIIVCSSVPEYDERLLGSTLYVLFWVEDSV